MLKVFKRAKTQDVEFCERCGEVCDSACRAARALDRAKSDALRHGIRVS